MNTILAADDAALVAGGRDRLVRRAGILVGPVDAEDVVHDAFERALSTRSFRGGADPRPWLDRIAHHIALDRLRVRTRIVPMPDALPPDRETPERSVLRRETARELHHALGRLPRAQRRAIVLHDVQGYSNHEIASLDGVPYQTVRTRLFRARRALRAALHPEAS